MHTVSVPQIAIDSGTRSDRQEATMPKRPKSQKAGEILERIPSNRLQSAGRNTAHENRLDIAGD